MTGSTIFCGCSYTQGVGLELEKYDPNLWVNLLHKSVPHLASTNLVNTGIGGASNEDIFLSALHNITTNVDCRYLFVSWTSLKRLTVNPSVETYDTKIYLERANIPDVKINPNVTIPGSYIENIRDRFFDLTHLHYDILKIFQYTSLINQLSSRFNIKVFFINSLLPIDTNYFIPVTSKERLPSDTTLYTQKLLNLDTRSNTEYFTIYDKIHSDYNNTGSLQCNWLNLDHGFRTHFYLDQGSDNLHPGVKSNQQFAHFLLEKIQTNNNL